MSTLEDNIIKNRFFEYDSIKIPKESIESVNEFMEIGENQKYFSYCSIEKQLGLIAKIADWTIKVLPKLYKKNENNNQHLAPVITTAN